MTRIATDIPPVCGEVAPGFEHVRSEFERNFRSRGETGAACTLYHHGVKVVDLWGGYRCRRSADPWTPDTLTLAFSVTKGMAAAAIAVAHSRGWFDLDDPVAAYWPEFAAQGKRDITVRQLLAHQAGLVAIDRRLDTQTLADLDRMAEITADQRPLWEPGSRHGYHTLTLGWYQNELLRRVDPKGRSLGQFFQDEVAEPLGIEFYIGLPDQVDEKRLSNVLGYHRFAVLGHLNQLPSRMVLAGIWPRSFVARSIRHLPLQNPAQLGGERLRRVEIPSANGIGQARAIARVYDCLSRGGEELGLTRDTWRELIAPAKQPEQGTYDTILKIDTRYRLGFSRPSQGFPFGSDDHAFGCPGAGGSFGMADPSLGISYAYLTNKLSFRIFNDPREMAVREACYLCLRAMRPMPMAG